MTAVAANATSGTAPTSQVAQLSKPVYGVTTFALPRRATHVAVHWRGHPAVHVRVSSSRDGVHFSSPRLVRRDEVGEQARDGETYGALMAAGGARTIRVWSSVRLPRLTIVALTDRGPAVPAAGRQLTSASQPSVISRAGWSADESLRFDSTGKEIWPPAFYPIQKVIVHHTATQNNDPDPAATIRSIYYYHAVTQGWGDIGYNFLIDEAGNVYEGRYSRQYAPGESPTGEDLNGNGVTGAHAQGYNSGTVGVALLGTLTNQDATQAARSALEHLIAWIDSTHSIDPQGSARYTNPVSGLQATFANIAGHRDVAATECPGGTFYATLPTIRSNVATLIAASAPDFSLGASPTSQTVTAGQSTSYGVAITPSGGFTDSVSLSISRLPSGATASFSPNPASGSSTLSVTTSALTPAGSYPFTITGTSGSLTRTATVTLAVNPPPTPGFSLSAAPTSQSVVRGSSTSYTITLVASGGFTGTVSLSVAGLPAGGTGSFNPNPTSSNAILTVTTGVSTKTGTYTLTVSGTSGGTTHSTTVSLLVKRK